MADLGATSLTGANTITPTTANTTFGGSSIVVPSGTTAQRPSSPPSGATRYNTSTLCNEHYDGSNWLADGIPTGSSAAAILSAYPQSRDGVYYIDLPTVGRQLTYCAMGSDYAGGGGWMLAWKCTRSGTFNWDANYWTTANTLNASALDTSDGDAKFHVFNYFTANKFLGFFPAYGAVTQAGPNNGGTTSTGRAGWHWLVTGQNSTCLTRFQTQETIVSNPRDATAYWGGSGFSAQGGFQTFRFNYVDNGSNRVRWGFGWNNEGDQGSNDVSGGIGMNRAGWSAGDLIGCCQSTTGFNTTCRAEIWVQ